MKVIMKLLLALAAIGGFLYWVFSKFGYPAMALHRRRLARKQKQQAEKDEDGFSTIIE
jgi:hypothetical protein